MKINSKILLIEMLLLIIFSNQVKSQTIVRRANVSTGGSASVLHYTFGEVFSTTMLNGNCMLTLGMQQMDPTLTTSISETTKENGINCLIYPNPASKEFILKIKSQIHSDALIRIYDNQGKLVLIKNAMIDFGTSEIKITTGEIQSGIYFLTITSGKSYSNLKLQII